MPNHPKASNDHGKHPGNIRVLMFRMPDGTYEAESINAGGIASGATPEVAVASLYEALDSMQAVTAEEGIAMIFDATPEDMELYLSFAETGPRRLDDGRYLLAAFSISRVLQPVGRV